MPLTCDTSTPYYADFIAVGEALRCPVCQGQRVASSDAPFALRVKQDICAALHEGLSADQVIARMEVAYGADLHVENTASLVMLPLIAVMTLMAVVAVWKIKKLAFKPSDPL
jgi:cytochrome c-type biogenesis protein CcmH/NrfF